MNVGSSMLFGGISGSSTSDTASIGSVLIPEMKKRGYPISFASGLTVASSTMGMIIPPSIPIVLYAVTAQESVGQLFLGGVIPGLMVGFFQLVIVHQIALRKKYPKEDVALNSKIFVTQLIRSLHVLIMPLIVVGVVVFGVATATESSGFGVLYAIIVGGFIIRHLTWAQFWVALKSTMQTSAKIMMIIAFSQVFVWVLAIERAPETLALLISQIQPSPTIMLLVFMLLFVVIVI